MIPKAPIYSTGFAVCMVINFFINDGRSPALGRDYSFSAAGVVLLVMALAELLPSLEFASSPGTPDTPTNTQAQ